MKKKNRIVLGIALAFVILAMVITQVISASQASATLPLYGSVGNTPTPTPTPTAPPTSADYTITGADGVYTGTNKNNPSQTTSGSSATTIVTTVLGWMSTGQSVEFIGNFAVNSMITVSKAVTLIFTQATITVTTNTAVDVKTSNVKIYGGQWIGPGAANPNVNTAVRFFGSGISNCLVDGGLFENFYASGVGNGIVFAAMGTSYITVQNCVMHGGGGGEGSGQPHNYAVNLQGGIGHHKVINCDIYDMGAGIFVSDSTEKNQIIDCKFHEIGPSHAIYLDGGSSNRGENEIYGCEFYNQGYNAGIQIKCPRNEIHDNVFHDFGYGDGVYSVCLSIYSQYNPSYANDNEIYDNTFSNVYFAFWITGGPGAPTTGNKIHDNSFTDVTHCIYLNKDTMNNWVRDTWIYYNQFSSCSHIVETSLSSPPNMVSDTVVAYNAFTPAVTDLGFETDFQNTMVYGNTGLADYNVPSSMPIPPP